MLPVAAQDPALVDLGRSLFFDKVLSGNRDVSCATCHSPLATRATDSRWRSARAPWSSAVTRRSAPAVNSRRATLRRSSTRRSDPSTCSGTAGCPRDRPGSAFRRQRVVDAARRAWRPGRRAGDDPGDQSRRDARRTRRRDVAGKTERARRLPTAENAAIWDAAMRACSRSRPIMEKFSAAYPGVPAKQLGFQHAANAIAAFEAQTFTKTTARFDRYLARDDNALSADAKRGALLFFGKALAARRATTERCSARQGFANAGVPSLVRARQLGAARWRAREIFVQRREDVRRRNSFSVLRRSQRRADAHRTCTTARTRRSRRWCATTTTPIPPSRHSTPSELDPSLRKSYHGEAATIAKVRASIDGRLQGPTASTTDGTGADRRVPQVAHRSVGARHERDDSGVGAERIGKRLTSHQRPRG